MTSRNHNLFRFQDRCPHCDVPIVRVYRDVKRLVRGQENAGKVTLVFRLECLSGCGKPVVYELHGLSSAVIR